MKRREFISTSLSAAAGACCLLGQTELSGAGKSTQMPSYLKGYEKLWATDPKAANEKWFRESRLGLFMHYGVSAVVASHVHKPLPDPIPLKIQFPVSLSVRSLPPELGHQGHRQLGHGPVGFIRADDQTHHFASRALARAVERPQRPRRSRPRARHRPGRWHPARPSPSAGACPSREPLC